MNLMCTCTLYVIMCPYFSVRVCLRVNVLRLYVFKRLSGVGMYVKEPNCSCLCVHVCVSACAFEFM